MNDRYYDLTEKQQNQVLEFMELTQESEIDLCIQRLEAATWNFEQAAAQYFQPMSPAYQDLGQDDQPAEEQVPIPGQGKRMPAAEFKARKLKRRQSEKPPPELKLAKTNTSVSPQKSEGMNLQEVRVIERNKQFILHLRKTYQSAINFRFGTLEQNFREATKRGKELLVYVQPFNDHAEQPTIQPILSHKALVNLLNSRFLCFGLFQNSPDAELLERYVPFSQWPCMAVVDCHDEPRVTRVALIRRLRPPEAMLSILAGETQEQLPVLKPKHSDHGGLIEQQQQEYDTILKELQAHEAAKQAELERQQSLQRAKQERRDYLRSLLSPEDEKSTLEVVVRLIDGAKITRRFQPSARVLELFQFVGSHEVEREDPDGEDFDLIQSFPRLGLADKQECSLGQIFPQSEREILHYLEK